MICNKCKCHDLGSCSTYGNLKSDKQIKDEGYSCFKNKFYHINETSKNIQPEDNMHFEEMSDDEVKKIVDHYSRVRMVNEKKVCNN